MTKYEVKVERTGYVTVEANNPQDAIKIAEEIDEDKIIWEPLWFVFGDEDVWEIDDAE